MQIDINRSEEVAQLISEAKNIAVIPSKIAGLDAFAAGAALTQMLKSADKNVMFIYPGQVPQSAEDLIAPAEIVSTLEERDLVVTVNYQDTQVDSVKYNTEDHILTFRLGPVPVDFDVASKVQAKVASYNFDLCFILGAQNLEELGSTYEILQKELHESKIVNIDTSKNNVRFGVVNIIEPEINGLSYLVFQKASSWNLDLPKSAALALLKGMSHEA